MRRGTTPAETDPYRPPSVRSELGQPESRRRGAQFWAIVLLAPYVAALIVFLLMVLAGRQGWGTPDQIGDLAKCLGGGYARGTFDFLLLTPLAIVVGRGLSGWASRIGMHQPVRTLLASGLYGLLALGLLSDCGRVPQPSQVAGAILLGLDLGVVPLFLLVRGGRALARRGRRR